MLADARVRFSPTLGRGRRTAGTVIGLGRDCIYNDAPCGYLKGQGGQNKSPRGSLVRRDKARPWVCAIGKPCAARHRRAERCPDWAVCSAGLICRFAPCRWCMPLSLSLSLLIGVANKKRDYIKHVCKGEWPLYIPCFGVLGETFAALWWEPGLGSAAIDSAGFLCNVRRKLPLLRNE